MIKHTHWFACAILATVVGFGPVATAQASKGKATCSDILDIDVHGEHIVGDYVTGLGHDVLDWPPQGGVVGAAVSSNPNFPVHGGPGPGAHFPGQVAPGASFCTDSRSPGAHF